MKLLQFKLVSHDLLPQHAKMNQNMVLARTIGGTTLDCIFWSFNDTH